MIEYTAGYKYVLYKDTTFQLSFAPEKTIRYEHITFHADNELEIKKGFPWDGMSGGVPDTDRNMQGSVVHDALYKLIRQGLLPMRYRHLADAELEIICVDDRVWEWVAAMYRWGLSRGGTAAALPSAIKRIHRAP